MRTWTLRKVQRLAKKKLTSIVAVASSFDPSTTCVPTWRGALCPKKIAVWNFCSVWWGKSSNSPSFSQASYATCPLLFSTSWRHVQLSAPQFRLPLLQTIRFPSQVNFLSAELLHSVYESRYVRRHHPENVRRTLFSIASKLGKKVKSFCLTHYKIPPL